MTTETLTGRTRFRIETLGLFQQKKVLVLEVEYTYYVSISSSVSLKKITRWRDATMADISTSREAS